MHHGQMHLLPYQQSSMWLVEVVMNDEQHTIVRIREVQNLLQTLTVALIPSGKTSMHSNKMLKLKSLNGILSALI